MHSEVFLSAYMIIGETIRIEYGNHYQAFKGFAIAGVEAFYLVVLSKDPGPLTGSLRLVGKAATAVYDVFYAGTRDPFLTELSQLPKSITSHPDWPIPKLKAGPVYVVPRQVIQRIDYAFWDTFDIQTKDHILSVCLYFFGRRKVLSFLRETWKF